VRAIDASLALDRSVERVLSALDDATAPGIVRAPLDEDDSLVMAIKDVVSPQSMVMDTSDSGKNPKIGG